MTLSEGFKKEDHYYHKTRSKMKWYLPLLREYIDKARSLGKNASNDANLAILEQYERQLTNPKMRVPINVLRTGERVLRQELSETNKPYDYMLESVWRTPMFREAISQRLVEAIKVYGNATCIESDLLESYVFERSKTRQEYLETSARVIVYLRKVNIRSQQQMSPGISSNSSSMQEQLNMPLASQLEDPMTSSSRSGITTTTTKKRKRTLSRTL